MRIRSRIARWGWVPAVCLLTMLAAGWQVLVATGERRLNADLVDAVAARHVDHVRALVSRGANPNSRQSRPLVIHGLGDLLRAALGRRNAAGGRPGVTALGLAAQNEDVATVSVLLQNGADPNADDGEGRRPLSEAARGLAASDGRVLVSLSSSAVQPHMYDVMLQLLDAGAKPDTQGALADAVWYARRADCVKLLLDRGAPTEVRDEVGQTPLFVAVQTGRVDLVRLLLAHGANADARDREQRTCIGFAAAAGDARTMKLLRQHGAAIDVAISTSAVENAGATPLQLARDNGELAAVRLLKSWGAAK